MTSRDLIKCIERYSVDVETVRKYRDYRFLQSLLANTFQSY